MSSLHGAYETSVKAQVLRNWRPWLLRSRPANNDRRGQFRRRAYNNVSGNAALVAVAVTANIAKLEALANAEKAKQASLAARAGIAAHRHGRRRGEVLMAGPSTSAAHGSWASAWQRLALYSGSSVADQVLGETEEERKKAPRSDAGVAAGPEAGFGGARLQRRFCGFGRDVMTAVSFSINRGVSGTTMTDITVGTSAPGAGDIELRYNILDTNSKNLNREDIYMALKAFQRAIEQGGTTVDITLQPSGPPS